MARIFVILGLVLGVLAGIAGLLLHTWLPLVAVGIVMLCVMSITLSEAAVFAPLLNLVMHAGERGRQKTITHEAGDQRPEIRDQRPEVREQKSEAGEQRSAGRGQRSEGGAP